MQHRIVVRYVDGRTAKGFIPGFNPRVTSFDLAQPAEPGDPKPPLRIDVSDLKALFFVKDFTGQPAHKERGGFLPHQPTQGVKVKVTFCDGEVVFGYTTNYSRTTPGFFVFPADEGSNMVKMYAMNAAVRDVQII